MSGSHPTPSVVRPGRIMFEIDGVDEATAKEALRLAAMKLPVKCKIVTGEAQQAAAGKEA